MIHDVFTLYKGNILIDLLDQQLYMNIVETLKITFFWFLIRKSYKKGEIIETFSMLIEVV